MKPPIGPDGVPRWYSALPVASPRRASPPAEELVQAAAAATLYQAMAVVNAGLCKTVLIWRAMNERSQYRFGQNPTNMQGYTGGHGTGSLLWCIPYGAMTPASWASLQAARYMHTYGLTNRDLGYVSVQQRKYAATNPKAWFYEKPITLEDHQNSKWIQEPWLRLLDCCQESDGGVAFLVTSLERARDLKQKPVRILGACQSIPYNVEVISNYYHDDLTIMPEAWGTAKRLYAQTGMRPSDMQAAMLYDAFTPHVLMQLEAFGFCGKGEAAAFVKSGGIAIDGKLPVNTHGGLLGEAYIANKEPNKAIDAYEAYYKKTKDTKVLAELYNLYKKTADAEKFRDYFDYAEVLNKVPSHRALAVFRGRALQLLDASLQAPATDAPGPSLAERALSPLAVPRDRRIRHPRHQSGDPGLRLRRRSLGDGEGRPVHPGQGPGPVGRRDRPHGEAPPVPRAAPRGPARPRRISRPFPRSTTAPR